MSGSAVPCEDIGEILLVVVRHRRSPDSVRAHGAGRCARLVRWIAPKRWSESLSLVRDHDFRGWAIGRMPRVGDESHQVNGSPQLGFCYELSEVQRVHDGRAALYADEPTSLCTMFELWILD